MHDKSRTTFYSRYKFIKFDFFAFKNPAWFQNHIVWQENSKQQQAIHIHILVLQFFALEMGQLDRPCLWSTMWMPSAPDNTSENLICQQEG